MSRELHEMYRISDGRLHKQASKEGDHELLKLKLQKLDRDDRYHKPTRQTDEFGRLIKREHLVEEEPKDQLSRIRKKLDKTAAYRGKKTGHEVFKVKKKKGILRKSAGPLPMNPFEIAQDQVKIQDRMKAGLKKALRKDTYMSGKQKGRWERKEVTALDLGLMEKEYRTSGTSASNIASKLESMAERKRKIAAIESEGFDPVQKFESERKRPKPNPPKNLTKDDAHFNAIFAAPSFDDPSPPPKDPTPPAPPVRTTSILNQNYVRKKKKGSWREKMRQKMQKGS